MLKIIFLILLLNYEILSFPQTIITKTTASTIAENKRHDVNNQIINDEKENDGGKNYEKVQKDNHKCGYEVINIIIIIIMILIFFITFC